MVRNVICNFYKIYRFIKLEMGDEIAVNVKIDAFFSNICHGGVISVSLVSF